MGSKSSPSVPKCSHSPDAVPIDSSVHKVHIEQIRPNEKSVKTILVSIHLASD